MRRTATTDRRSPVPKVRSMWGPCLRPVRDAITAPRPSMAGAAGGGGGGSGAP